MTARHLLLLVGAALLATSALARAQERPTAPSAAQEKPAATTAPQPKAGEWRPMFDGKTLAGWKESAFVSPGKVSIQDGTVVLGDGYITGITWTGPFPTADYEVRYEAQRVQGSDFFGALTFPVGDSFCTFINGGWGGELVGLSSLDGMDASENETNLSINFQNGRWYAFRVRVTGTTIEAWVGEEQVIGVDVRRRRVGLRPGDIEKSRPLGLASYESVAALRKIEYRTLEK